MILDREKDTGDKLVNFGSKNLLPFLFLLKQSIHILNRNYIDKLISIINLVKNAFKLYLRHYADVAIMLMMLYVDDIIMLC